MKKLPFLLVLICAASLVANVTTAQQTKPTQNVDEKADKLLHQMSDLLGNSKSFTLNTKEVHDKIRESGKKVQAKVSREIAVRRPDGFWSHVISQAPDKSRDLLLWYDGKTITLQSDKEKVYARTKMPPTIDEALDYISDTLNVPTPVADIFYSTPYEAFIGPDTTGKYVKLDKVDGKSCHQLAFQNPILDWRIWIAAGDQALPCKLELTYKLDYGSPKIAITYLNWNFAPQLAENKFSHQPPADYNKIKIIGRVPMEEKPAGANTQTQENQQ